MLPSPYLQNLQTFLQFFLRLLHRAWFRYALIAITSSPANDG
jgi:hypothetical protein